jgi:hypothetical protein
MDHTEMMAVLADAAVLDQPRLFAVHGLYRRPGAGPVLGWGMEFAADLGALYADPAGTTYRSSSAEAVLRTLRRVGDVELTWLTEGPRG